MAPQGGTSGRFAAIDETDLDVLGPLSKWSNWLSADGEYPCVPAYCDLRGEPLVRYHGSRVRDVATDCERLFFNTSIDRQSVEPSAASLP